MSLDIAALADEVRGQRAQWAWHLATLAIVIALILAAFPFEVAQALEVWWIYPTYSHCFLIAPISLWLVWEKRHLLAQVRPSLAPWALFLIPPLLLVWVAGKIATVNEVRQFVVVGLIEVAILAMVGWRIYRAVLFPALYLFFLVPFGQYLIPPLQDFATWFTDHGLTLIGIPHYTEGTIIELANGRYEIAEACAGLRFLIATVALGVLFTHIVYRRWYKIFLFLAASVIIPLIGNGLRCLGIITLAHYTDNQIAVGADHLIYGWIFNMAILAVLFVIGLGFRDPFHSAPVIADEQGRAPSRTALFAVAFGAALIFGLAPAFAYWQENRPVQGQFEVLAQPFRVVGWSSVDAPRPWHPDFGGADGEAFTTLSRGAETVDIVIEFYGRNREGRSLVAATNELWDSKVWHETGSGTVDIHIGTLPAKFRENSIIARGSRRLVWSSYWMDGRFTTSLVRIKLLQLKALLTGQQAAAAIIVSTPVEGTLDEARDRLQRVLSSSGLAERLNQAAGQVASARLSLD